MQSYALTVDKFLDHAAKWFPTREVVEATADGGTRRITYAALRERSNRASGALAALGLTAGDRVATLAWNTIHHLEIYYAAMGAGMVCHTLNPRLSPAHLAAIVTEAHDRVLAVAIDLLPLAREVALACPCIERIVVLDAEAAIDEAGALPVVDYATWVARHGCESPWGTIDENAPAGLCYTSGTTGKPKGVVYTHRSNYLHTLRALQADALAITARDALLLAVPMFHANGWGLPFAAPAAGTALVLPGRALDGASLARLMREERTTIAVGVQTVWLAVADQLDAAGGDLPDLARVVIGGSSCPAALLRRLEARLGAAIQTSWGMTELSPIGTIAPPGTPPERAASGRPAIGVDLRLTDADGVPLSEQRGVEGHLTVRGHSVLDRYYGADTDALDADGWFDTGDLATIDADGQLTINGRAKDLIKSGGEWINPTEIEAIVGAHPAVRHVAVIARTDAKWGERPVLIVDAEGAGDARDLLTLLRGQVPDWWLPSEVAAIPAMPLAASGKIDKARLRDDFAAGRITATSVAR